jgi:hypothetical protein
MPTFETPLLLVTTALPSFSEHPCPDTGAERHPHLGRLLQPRHTCRIPATAEAGIPWACDNDCFNGLNAPEYVKMLDKITDVPGCKFVTVPDVLRCAYCMLTKDGYGGGGGCGCTFGPGKPPLVVGDAALTLQRFEEWLPRVQETGQPIGYVAQNGLSDTGVPWELIDALFIGGDDTFKLGDEAADWARQAMLRGKWVHWGRVNTRKRIRHCTETGACDSMDGSSWARFRKARPKSDPEHGERLLDKGLRWVREAAEAPAQLIPRGMLA